jgi:hypothetical protein
MARRGWIEKKDVLNALPVEQLMKRLREMRAGRLKTTAERTKSAPARRQEGAGKRKG